MLIMLFMHWRWRFKHVLIHRRLWWLMKQHIPRFLISFLSFKIYNNDCFNKESMCSPFCINSFLKLTFLLISMHLFFLIVCFHLKRQFFLNSALYWDLCNIAPKYNKNYLFKQHQSQCFTYFYNPLTTQIPLTLHRSAVLINSAKESVIRH